MLLAQRLQLSEGQHKPSAQASGQKHFMSGKTNRAHTEPDRIMTGAHRGTGPATGEEGSGISHTDNVHQSKEGHGC